MERMVDAMDPDGNAEPLADGDTFGIKRFIDAVSVAHAAGLDPDNYVLSDQLGESYADGLRPVGGGEVGGVPGAVQ